MLSLNLTRNIFEIVFIWHEELLLVVLINMYFTSCVPNCSEWHFVLNTFDSVHELKYSSTAVVVVVVYWRIHYIHCHNINLTVIYNDCGYSWEAEAQASKQLKYFAVEVSPVLTYILPNRVTRLGWNYQILCTFFKTGQY